VDECFRICGTTLVGPEALRDVAHREEHQLAGEIRVKRGSFRFGIVAMLMLATAIFLQVRSHREVFPPRAGLTDFPRQLEPWTANAFDDVPFDEDVLDILGRSGEFLHRKYRSKHPSEREMEELFIAYYPSQRTGETIHSPQHCWPGAGYTPIRKDIITVSVPGHGPFLANRYLFLSEENDRTLDIYWFWAHDRGVASEYTAKRNLIKDSIQMNRSDGGLIEIAIKMDPGETVEAAEQRMLPFAAAVVPLLNDYIPR
jgi:EpsI family protein